jgi:aerobic carbon-monoxide dehydrogenase medium subunit
MKPPPFEYYDPTTIEEAVYLLGRYGTEARLLAGGQSLVPQLNFRLSTPAVIVDLNRIPQVSYIRQEDGQLCFGAMTRQRQIQFSELVAQKIPLMVEATRFIGHLPTRTRGTIGGSLAHADPCAEFPTLVTALDGEMVVHGPSGERILKPRDFFRGPWSTAMRPDEILTEVRLPTVEDRSGWAFEELALRENHVAIVEVAAQLTVDQGGSCMAARLAVGGCVKPTRLRIVEEILEREGLGDRVLREAAVRAAELVDPINDFHASGAYRRRLTRVLVGRALTRATAMARRMEKTDG